MQLFFNVVILKKNIFDVSAWARFLREALKVSHTKSIFLYFMDTPRLITMFRIFFADPHS